MKMAALSNSVKQVIHQLGRQYVRKVTQSEAEGQKFSRHNERSAEYAFVFRHITSCAPRTVLDVGTRTTALPAQLAACGCVVTAIDNVHDYWPAGMVEAGRLSRRPIVRRHQHACRPTRGRMLLAPR